MSKLIFSSLENIDLTAPQPPWSSSPSFVETPSVSHQHPAPQEFDMENSQQSCQPFPPLTNYTQAPLPSIATLNVASAIRHYLLQKSASISDTEEILKFINVRGSIANTLVSLIFTRNHLKSVRQWPLLSLLWRVLVDKWLLRIKFGFLVMTSHYLLVCCYHANVLLTCGHAEQSKLYSNAINLTPTIRTYSPMYTAPLLVVCINICKWNTSWFSHNSFLSALWNGMCLRTGKTIQQRKLHWRPRWKIILLNHKVQIKRRYLSHVPLTLCTDMAKLLKSVEDDSTQDIYELCLSLTDGMENQITLPFVYRIAFLVSFQIGLFIGC